MNKAICSECGNACEVPFKPTGDKPVYCSDCFRNKGGNTESKSSSKRFDRRDSDKSNFGEKECIQRYVLGVEINAKSHFNQQAVNQFIVIIVLRKMTIPEIKIQNNFKNNLKY